MVFTLSLKSDISPRAECYKTASLDILWVSKYIHSTLIPPRLQCEGLAQACCAWPVHSSTPRQFKAQGSPVLVVAGLGFLFFYLFLLICILGGDLLGHHDPLLPTNNLENSSLFRVP